MITTDQKQEEVIEVFNAVDGFLSERNFNTSISAAALMMLAANAATFLDESDDYIVNEFRRCLKSIRFAMANETGQEARS